MAWIGAGNEQKSVGIVGMGYVGLPLAMQFASTGNRVLGFDVDAEKASALKQGESYIGHIPSEELAKVVNASRLDATTDFSRIGEVEAILICVPTPLTRHREPDLSYVLSTGEQIGPHLKAGQLVILESTTYPGTTDEKLGPVLEKLSGLKTGTGYHLAYSPEREDPGNPTHKTADIPKVVGGITQVCGEAARELYEAAEIRTIPVTSTRAAEATKLIENIFRAVNIAMVNELKVVFEQMGIDIWEVVEAAKTKPFGYMPFYPGPGWGGHCIPIDPFYLTWKAREYGVATRFIELAGEINTNMPQHVVQRVQEALSNRDKPLKKAKILILGVAYKKNVGDIRESPSLVLWEILSKRGAVVSYHDPYVDEIRPTREHPEFAGERSVELTEDALKSYDCVLISTDHTDVDYDLVTRNAPLVVDTRNACARMTGKLERENVVKA